jgi:hypothetical protein
LGRLSGERGVDDELAVSNVEDEVIGAARRV